MRSESKIMCFCLFTFQSAELSVFETNIRFVGGFLTMYSLTGEQMYKDKAQEVADKLLPAFQTPTGIPHALVNIRMGVSTIWKSLFGYILAINPLNAN